MFKEGDEVTCIGSCSGFEIGKTYKLHKGIYTPSKNFQVPGFSKEEYYLLVKNKDDILGHSKFFLHTNVFYKFRKVERKKRQHLPDWW